VKPGRREQLTFAARKAERAQRRDVRALVRRQNRLGKSAIGKRLHLGEALQRSLARIRDLTLVALGSEVAGRQAAIVVRGSRQAVEVDLFGHGFGLPGAGRDCVRHGEIALVAGWYANAANDTPARRHAYTGGVRRLDGSAPPRRLPAAFILRTSAR